MFVIRQSVWLHAARAMSVVAATATAVFAQTPPASSFVPTWDLTIYAGGSSGAAGSSGIGALPDVKGNITFPTATSRIVPSWYFGDGALLFAQANANLALSTSSLVSLDDVLTTASARRQGGPVLGARIGGPVTRRVRLEFGVDWALTSTALSDAARAGIEASSERFTLAWQALQRVVNASASSVATFDTSSSRQLTLDTGVAVDVVRVAGGTLFVVAGAGIAMTTGDPAGASLTGNYRFTSGSRTLDETDAVRIRVHSDGRAPVWILGGRYERDLSARLAIRGDAAWRFTAHELALTVDADPSRVTNPNALPSIVALGAGTVPGSGSTAIVLFQDSPTVPIASLDASLDSFQTFRGDGYMSSLVVTAGLVVRF